MAVVVSDALPVFARITVCGLLTVSEAWLGNVSESGLAVAVVRLAPAVHSGVCHTPRPYVAAVRTCAEAVAGEALRATTGASGKPVPNVDQQVEGRFMQEEICVVK
jgi:hypothetical protein